jgi:hypothetical protein
MDAPGYVYVLAAQGIAKGLYKIGKANNVGGRLKSFTKLPFPVDLIHEIESPNALGLEFKIHKYFASKRAEGEWFYLTDEDIAFLLTVESIDDIELPEPINPKADRISEGKVRTGFVITKVAHRLITEMAEAQRVSRNTLIELMVTEYAADRGFLPEDEPERVRVHA